MSLSPFGSDWLSGGPQIAGYFTGGTPYVSMPYHRCVPVAYISANMALDAESATDENSKRVKKSGRTGCRQFDTGNSDRDARTRSVGKPSLDDTEKSCSIGSGKVGSNVAGNQLSHMSRRRLPPWGGRQQHQRHQNRHDGKVASAPNATTTTPTGHGLLRRSCSLPSSHVSLPALNPSKLRDDPHNHGGAPGLWSPHTLTAASRSREGSPEAVCNNDQRIFRDSADNHPSLSEVYSDLLLSSKRNDVDDNRRSCNRGDQRNAYDVHRGGRGRGQRGDHGVDDFLAHPTPSLDEMLPRSNRDLCRPTEQRMKDDGRSTFGNDKQLPTLSVLRSNGNVNDDPDPNRDELNNPFRSEGSQWARAPFADTCLSGSGTKKKQHRRSKGPSRSQSVQTIRVTPRPSPSDCRKSAVRARDLTKRPKNSKSNHTTVYEGVDAVLLQEAFLCADRTVRDGEKERDGHRRRRPRGGSPVPYHQQSSCLRHTKSSHFFATEIRRAGRAGGRKVKSEELRIEVEDWLRGLPTSSLQTQEFGFKPRKKQGRRHERSQDLHAVNPEKELSLRHVLKHRPGAERQALLSGRRNDSNTFAGCARPELDEGTKLRFDQRHEKEEYKRASTTADLVERFQSGAGLEMLRAELESSQAAMRRSTQAIEQVASRWHQPRGNPASLCPP